jgi:CubicO group peptidase (beta-lactamase class C family)
MKQLLRLLTILFYLLWSLITKGQTTSTEKLDAIIETVETEQQGMGSISIFKEGKEVYQKTFGVTNIETKTKADASTVYRIGSVTKMYTAAIIIQMVEENKLKLDAPLSAFFPEIPNASKITIENLLKHQSGLFNVTEDAAFSTWMFQPQSRVKMLERVVKNGSIFEPGTSTTYCNTNFILLSYIAEEIDGEGFDAIVLNRISKRLGLAKTKYGVTINPTHNEALSHALNDGNWEVVTDYTHMSAPMGAGALVATVSEVNAFTTALYMGNLMTKSSFEKMTDVSSGMGMGLGGAPILGMKGFGMSGQIDGFKSLAIFFPEQKVSMSILSNGYNGSLQTLMMPVVQSFFAQD